MVGVRLDYGDWVSKVYIATFALGVSEVSRVTLRSIYVQSVSKFYLKSFDMVTHKCYFSLVFGMFCFLLSDKYCGRIYIPVSFNPLSL